MLALLLACQPADTKPRPDPAAAAEDTALPADTRDTAVDPADTAADTADPAPSADTSVDVIGGPDPVVYPHLPVLRLDVDGQITTLYKIDGWMEVIRDHDGTLTDLEAAPRDWEGHIGIEMHGSSSTGFPKLSYRIETREEEQGDDVEVPLLGFPAESDWVLYAPYTDKTLIRDAFAYTLGAAMSADTGEWQPGVAFSELFLNGEYRGVYMVTERIKWDGSRLDLPRPAERADEGDVTGGYIVKIDQHRNEGFDTAAGTPIDYAYPLYEDLTPQQREYMWGWFDDFEAALLAPGWDDPKTGYPAWIEVDSWIDHFIVNELSHNVDAYRLSAYLYKDADADGGKLHAGPLWDFNLAFGNVDYCYCWEIEGFIIDSLTQCGYGYQYPFWWEKLLEDPAFTERLRCRWEELRVGLLADEALTATLDALAAQVAAAEPRDHATWGTLGVYVWPNYYIGETYGDEVEYLRQWVLNRAAWLDEAMPGTCGG